MKLITFLPSVLWKFLSNIQEKLQLIDLPVIEITLVENSEPLSLEVEASHRLEYWSNVDLYLALVRKRRTHARTSLPVQGQSSKNGFGNLSGGVVVVCDQMATEVTEHGRVRVC